MELKESVSSIEHARIKAANRMAYGISRIALMLFTLTLLSFAAPLWWGLELLSHFAWHYMIVSIVLAAILLKYRRVFFLLIALLTIGINVFKVYPLYKGSTEIVIAQQEMTQGSDIKILQYNLLDQNVKKEALLDWLLTQSVDVDVMVLLEVSQEWREALRPLIYRYDQAQTANLDTNKGILVLTRLATQSSNAIKIGGREVIKIKAYTPEFLVPISIYALHAISPLSKDDAKERDTLLSAVAKMVKSERDTNVIVVGDFNTTPFSPIFNKMIEDTNLKNSGQGIGYLGTWPSVMPSELGIPIDHLLISKNISTINKNIYRKRLGSDHYPVITMLSVKRP